MPKQNIGNHPMLLYRKRNKIFSHPQNIVIACINNADKLIISRNRLLFLCNKKIYIMYNWSIAPKNHHGPLTTNSLPGINVCVNVIMDKYSPMWSVSVSHRPFPYFIILTSTESGISGIMTFQKRNILFQMKCIFSILENSLDEYFIVNPYPLRNINKATP